MKIFSPTITGSTYTSGSIIVSGSVIATQGFTGSVFGSSSYAIQALTASYALNVPDTASTAISSS